MLHETQTNISAQIPLYERETSGYQADIDNKIQKS